MTSGYGSGYRRDSSDEEKSRRRRKPEVSRPSPRRQDQSGSTPERLFMEYDGAAEKLPTGERKDGASTFQTAAGLVARVPRACRVTSSTPTGSHEEEDGVES